MKHFTTIIFLFFWVIIAHSQTTSTASAVYKIPDTRPDTTPVWVIVLDSVRMFAADPNYDMRMDVVAGWRVSRLVPDGHNFYVEDKYFDTTGTQLDNDIVLFAKKRRVVPNRFRQ